MAKDAAYYVGEKVGMALVFFVRLLFGAVAVVGIFGVMLVLGAAPFVLMWAATLALLRYAGLW